MVDETPSLLFNLHFHLMKKHVVQSLRGPANDPEAKRSQGVQHQVPAYFTSKVQHDRAKDKSNECPCVLRKKNRIQSVETHEKLT